MERIRLNGITVIVEGANVIIEDVYKDVGEKEANAMVRYLVSEGFIPNGKVHVLIRRKNKDDGSQESSKG
jgi:hypothetical protein